MPRKVRKRLTQRKGVSFRGRSTRRAPNNLTKDTSSDISVELSSPLVVTVSSPRTTVVVPLVETQQYIDQLATDPDKHSVLSRVLVGPFKNDLLAAEPSVSQENTSLVTRFESSLNKEVESKIMDWSFDSDIKTEDIKIVTKSEEELEEPKEWIKTEIEVKFNIHEQRENEVVKNEDIEIKIEENEQESLEHLKELSEPHEDEEAKNHTLITEIISEVQINTLRSNSSQNAWKCCLCHSACKDKFDLREHISATHKDPSNSNLFKCDLCSYITEYLHKLVMHKAQHKSHTDVLHHQFEALDAVTEQKSNVENKKQKCGACDFRYENEIDLREHITATHKDPFNSNMFKCNICISNIYRTKYFHRLTLHMSSHDSPSNTNWYFCDKCTYRSRHKEYLKQHNLRHLSISDSDLYKCSKCSFRSKSHGVLLRHLLAHKKQYQCEMCDYKTIYKWRIKMHVVKHKELSEVEVYECILCDFRTKWTTSFNKHLSRHDKKLL